MGETCLDVPARVFGFESSASIVDQPQKSPGQLEQRASLLSALLRHPALPTATSALHDSSSETDSESDVEMEDAEAEETEDSNEEPWEAGGGGSAPMPIPRGDGFLKAQREALERFLYAHQIEEMRRQCAVYFARQARFNEVIATDHPMEGNVAVPAASVEAGGLARGVPEPASRVRNPGF